MAANTKEWNPQNVDKKEYKEEIGSTVNEVEEYVCRRIKDFVKVNGKPQDHQFYFTQKALGRDKQVEIMMNAIKSMDWNQDN